MSAAALSDALELGGFHHRVSAHDILSSSFGPDEVDAAVATGDINECYNMVLCLAPVTSSPCITGTATEFEIDWPGLGLAIQTTKSSTPKIAAGGAGGAGGAGAAGGSGSVVSSFSPKDLEGLASTGRGFITVSKHLEGVKVLRLPGGLPPFVDYPTYSQRLMDLYSQLMSYPEATLCVFEGMLSTTEPVQDMYSLAAHGLWSVCGRCGTRVLRHDVSTWCDRPTVCWLYQHRA